MALVLVTPNLIEVANAKDAPASETPWNDGVTKEQKAKAQPFFDAGNDYFERSMYSKVRTTFGF
tara:strand:+ start:147328 stop:147519 length:192 start_codon:yes stop_codon:yes gene_type:complete